MKKRVLFFVLLSFNALGYAQQVCDNKSIPASTPLKGFVIQQDATVLDTKTGLIWQRCLAGQIGSNCAGQADTFNWQQALKFAAEQTDDNAWRLPNIRELASIVELQCTRPAINLAIFPNHSIAHVWSSSPYRFYDHYAWYLDFEDGIYIYADRQDKKHIRLVRNSD